MKTNVNEIARNISRLTTEEIDELNVVLRDKYGFNSNIYKFPAGIISLEEQTKFEIRLSNAGTRKLAVLKRIKELFVLGLKEAKDIIDSAPCILIENISLEQAENLKDELEDLGATIDIL